MLDYIEQIFRENPAIPLFLTIGIGFWLGSLKFKSFSLGTVTATLLVGVIIGQMDIPISEPLKTVSFLIFLFSIGYSVGPQFFRSLKGEGLKQIIFAVVVGLLCVGTCLAMSKIMGYSKGIAIGVFSGSQTISAVIGVGTDTLKGLGLSKPEFDKMVSMIPACYAVTYIFGTIGTSWLIANLGPMMMGGLKKVKEETERIEAEMDQGEFSVDPGYIVANRPISFRAYRAESDFFDRPRRIYELEDEMKRRGLILFIERVRVKGIICDPQPDMKIRKGDLIVLSGRRVTVIEESSFIGPEIVDDDLLNFATENLPVTVARNKADGKTIKDLRKEEFMRGVIIRSISRNDVQLPIHSNTVLEAGDVLILVGLPQDVAVAVPEIGYSDRATNTTDITFLSLGIAIGCFIGVLTVYYHGIPLSLSSSCGVLIAGLFLGWWRNKRPSFGRIPPQVTWIMDNMGLNLFIAVVGIQAGPTFIEGLKEVGLSLFFIGIACTTIPMILAIPIGHKLFKFPAAVTLGCVAGSRNAVAALGAIQDSIDSTLPAMGYTVTYAVGNFMLIFSGILITLLA